MFELPDPPHDLGPNCAAFYVELRRMLESLQGLKISTSASTVAFSEGCLELWLVHAEREDWFVGVNMGESNAIVEIGFAHEHFEQFESAESVSRPWTTEMVDFIAEALTGDIEIQTTFRGSTPVTVRHFRIEPDGSLAPLGSTGFLTPRRAMFWLPRTSQSERISFS